MKIILTLALLLIVSPVLGQTPAPSPGSLAVLSTHTYDNDLTRTVQHTSDAQQGIAISEEVK